MYMVTIERDLGLGLVYTLFSRVLRDSTTRFVGPSVRRPIDLSIRHSHYFFWVFEVFGLTAPAQMIK